MRLRAAPGESEPRLDLGDLGATHGNAMRGRAVKFDHRSIALLANEADMRDRHNMAAMDPDEQAGIKLGFGLRDRPWAHSLAGAVMNPGVMGVGPDAAHIGCIDKMRAVGDLDRQTRDRRGAWRLAQPTERSRNRPLPPGTGRAQFRREGVGIRSTCLRGGSPDFVWQIARRAPAWIGHQ